ncbi:MAG: S41 family peptidase [Erysipelotrichaceae bacterium]|nr:S41 family peptidase [Erysipelotrichaceae bacterium]
MDEEKKVVYKLKKQELSSERQEKAPKRTILIVALCLLMGWVGFAIGYLGRRQSPPPVSPSATSAPARDKKSILSGYLESVWLYRDDYEDLQEVLDEKAYHGMVSFPDDPYTAYMSAEELNTFSSDINMNFVGIGISYYQNEGISTIIQVYKDTPADTAGLMAGDILVAVDGKPVEGISTDEIKAMVIGEEGTKVVITVNREGEELSFDVFRARVDTTVYAWREGDTAVLEIYSFGDNSYNECVKYLDTMKDCKKLIIDLRDNGGGYQTAVEDIAGLFLPKGTVMMRQVYADGHEESFKTRSAITYDNFEHIVILTNGYTASAAEVLTIALKEMHPDAVSVGETTYGKGVVQTTYPLYDGSAIKVTVSKWLSPNGVWINEEGVKVDEEVKLDEALYITFGKFPEGESYGVDTVSAYNKAAELALRFLGYDIERTDGYLSAGVAEAVRAYQQDRELEVTGEINEETFTAISSGVTRLWQMDHSKDAQLMRALEILKTK